MSSKEKNEMDILNHIINSQEQLELTPTVSPPPKSKNIDEMTCEEKLAHYMKMHDEQTIFLKEKEELLILTREELDILNKQIENLHIELWGKEQDYNELFRNYKSLENKYKMLESHYKKLQVNHLGNLYTDIAKSDGPNKPNKRMRTTGGRRKRKKTRNKRKKRQKKSRRK